MVSALLYKGRSTAALFGRPMLPSAPSVAGPERFAAAAQRLPRAYSFGETLSTLTTSAFQSADSRAVLSPESFRGGCSFGSGYRRLFTTLAGLSRVQGFGLRAVA